MQISQNKSQSKCFRLRKQSFLDLILGTVFLKNAYTSEWSLSCTCTTPEVKTLFLLFVMTRSSKVKDVFVILVGELIKLCRLEMSSKSSKDRPSFGGLSGVIRSAL